LIFQSREELLDLQHSRLYRHSNVKKAMAGVDDEMKDKDKKTLPHEEL